MAIVSTTSEEVIARLASEAGMTVAEYEAWSRRQARLGMEALSEEFADDMPLPDERDEDDPCVLVSIPVHPRTLATFREHGRGHVRRMGEILDRIAEAEHREG